MKKFYSFLFAAVALVGFAACNSDSTEDQPTPAGVEKVSFKANIDTTKTDLDGLQTVWVAGDVVKVNGFNFICEEDLTTFTCTETGCSALQNEATLTAVYNEEIDSTKGTAGAKLVGEGNLKDGISFQIMSAFLKFTTAVDVTLEGTNSLFSAATVAIAKAGEHYVAINPGEATLSYSNGGEKIKEVNMDFKAGKIYNLGFLATKSGWEISDGTPFLTTETADLFVAKNVKLAAPNFCLHKVGDTAWGAGAKYGLVNAGTKNENTAIGLYSASWSNDITISNAATTAHDIYFDKANSRLYVLTVGKTPAEIAAPTHATSYNIGGAMNGWGDSLKDAEKFTYCGDDVWHLTIELAANSQFKVKTNNDWNKPNYGYNQIQDQVGKSLFNSQADGNAAAKAKGTYEIWVVPAHGDKPLYILKK